MNGLLLILSTKHHKVSILIKTHSKAHIGATDNSKESKGTQLHVVKAYIRISPTAPM